MDMNIANSAFIEERNLESSSELAELMGSGELFLAYQPIIDVRSGGAIYYEAFSRLLLPTGKIMEAGEYISKLKDSPLFITIDLKTLELSFCELVNLPNLRLSINVQINSIANKFWLLTLDKLLDMHPSVKGRLIFEMDEHSCLNMPQIVIDFMKEYQAKGVSFALDNFGKGHSSLRYFTQYQFDILKIDEYYIRSIHDDVDKTMITKILSGISKEFDVYCIAEKVETEHEARWLSRMGIYFQQGRYFSEPMFGSVLRKLQVRQFQGPMIS
jgi:EAL domain-containing protein (putative c-di-GMP-specific phosphodiesterase class I)